MAQVVSRVIGVARGPGGQTEKMLRKEETVQQETPQGTFLPVPKTQTCIFTITDLAPKPGMEVDLTFLPDPPEDCAAVRTAKALAEIIQHNWKVLSEKPEEEPTIIVPPGLFDPRKS